MKPIIQIYNISNTAHKKISVAKIKPTVTFTARDSVDTPPAITAYVASVTPFMMNHNQLTRVRKYPDHEKNRDTLYLSLIARNNISGDKYRIISVTKRDTATITETNRFPRFHTWQKVPESKTVNGGYCEHHPYKPLLFGGTYHIPAINNTNHADKPAFRHDWLYLFDKLSEDDNA